jgi:glycosyltransferase involved in cell wall biosynthesis
VRIAVLWTRLSGYLNACLKELASRPDVELLVIHEVAGQDAPFDAAQFAWIQNRVEFSSGLDRDGLLAEVEQFGPDVVLVSSWHITEFRFVLAHLRPRPLRVLCMDNQWHGTWKQRFGALGSRWYVRRLYDAVFLPGERQASFARRLGFANDRIWQGLLCPDQALATATSIGDKAPPRTFGYLGRLSVHKGFSDLLDSYERYRRTTPDPWDLIVAGAGPLESEIHRHPTVIHAGFVQPDQLAAWFGRIGCLVVPSRFEPWGVVISEAATIGLPIIATDACGAVPHLVHDFANGRIARTADVASIAACLAFVSGLDDDGRAAMGRTSRCLASPYTTARWADTIVEGSAALLYGRSPQ